MAHHPITPLPPRALGATRPVLPAVLAALLSVLLAGPAMPAGALEISGTFRLGNMSFAEDRAEDDVDFAGDQYQWGAELAVTQAISEDLTFSSSIRRELVLRNTVYNMLTYRQSFVRVGVGPFFGLFNSTASILKPGISTSVQLDFPGVAYVLFRSDSSIGGRLVEIGDYTQERSDISAGFYARNVIVSAVLETRRFSQKTGADAETVDTLSIYALQTDIFRKNAPYKVLLSFGYHQLGRAFVHPDETLRHIINSVVVGTDVDMYLTPYLTVSLNLESSVYSFGSGELFGISNPGPGGYLFRAYAGASLNTEKIPSRDRSD
jgi:hypothetical protein